MVLTRSLTPCWLRDSWVVSSPKLRARSASTCWTMLGDLLEAGGHGGELLVDEGFLGFEVLAGELAFGDEGFSVVGQEVVDGGLDCGVALGLEGVALVGDEAAGVDLLAAEGSPGDDRDDDRPEDGHGDDDKFHGFRVPSGCDTTADGL